MSGRTVISVRGLGKRYQLGETFSHKATLRDVLATGARRVFRRREARARADQEFWALRDVSFDVAEGEVLGVIGSNGAGKSTLLKILSQITEPTEGEVRVRGRVASLLEVGTGFHHELSGRENVFMNGAILGMTQAEIRRKFDEIVEFAGVEAFIDTPVKRYSSGMLVRLAFAVAAHLEPEILVIDEVLAVGDERFQKRCLRKMDEVSRSGRTVLFVSHQMAAVDALCSRCLLLGGGRILASGSTADVVAEYRKATADSSSATVDLESHPGRPADRLPLMRRVDLMDSNGVLSGTFRPGATLRLVVEHARLDREISPVLGVVVKAGLHGPVFGIDNRFIDGYRLPPTREPGRIACTIPDLPLLPGVYSMDLYFGDSVASLDVVRDAVSFEVVQSDVYGTGRLPHANSGSVLWRGQWDWARLEAADPAPGTFVLAGAGGRR